MNILLDRVEYVPIVEDDRRGVSSRKRIASALSVSIKIMIGVLLCASPWTAVLVVGWTFRLMRRRIVRGWWDRSPSGERGDFDSWSASAGVTVPPDALPRWILAERFSAQLDRATSDGERPGRVRKALRVPPALVGSLALNLGAGLRAIGCTYVLTLPACGLWLGSWYAGWNTSFTKGYENAFVGAQTGVFAHVMFIVAMLYVPMAWAHLAASGRAWSFFHFGLVGRLIWRSGGSMALFAAVFALASLPVLALRAAPFAFTLSDPDAWADATPAEILRFAERYEMAAGVYLFLAFVGLHLLIARIYRRALLRALQRDPRLADRLPEPTRLILAELRLIPDGPIRRGPIAQATRWGARTSLNLAAGLGSALLWFVVIAEIYLGQFLNHIPWAGWLNVPLIHLPALQTTPAGLG
ncbi:hypothetical protein [Tautonia plasticadhaerens]|uniref:Uncharacterized protein n=1 Tax=Tautonia plasticadhaerens TaxID=2527974 RepID=A0A518H8V9_9BACT|nr:hypothetical protein [Tautonia plasticadhaerens]QDV37274.1 hypothetical protein ElP_52090 [Tautonia plasticadhaerens]